MNARFNMPHPAIVCSGPQLDKVITELEAGTYPQPDEAIWRGDLPHDLAVRLAKATGATDEQISEIVSAAAAAWSARIDERCQSAARQRDAVGTGPDPAPEPEPEPEPGGVIIRHTHADGTLVYGTSKGDGTAEILRRCRFRWFPSIKLWGVAQSRDHLAKRWQIDEAAKALRAAGHVVTVEIDDTPRDVTDVKADRGERLDARYDRLTTRAERQAAEATARFNRADQIGERFAGGQPILVGHHSERGARADHKRMDQAMRAGIEAQRKAEHAAEAAAVVGRADAYRERPGVIIRRIARLEAELRQTMHRINGTRPANDWRGAYYRTEDNPATGERLEALTARRTFLEHQLEADRAALAEHEASGYLLLSRDKVHKGDRVHWGATWGDGVHGAIVTRTNPRTVTLDRTSYPRTLPYERIQRVECPHEGTAVTVTAPGPATPKRERPAVVIDAPAEREAPLQIDARFEFFPTPEGVAVRMATVAGMYEAGYDNGADGWTVLEPSAGLGAIAYVAVRRGAEVDCVELNGQLAERLTRTGHYRSVRCADFLEVAPDPVYDRVLMNPPFAHQADIKHVTHALGFLKPGGMLVAIMSAGVEFRTDKAAETFRKLVADRGGLIDPLPGEAFKQSGTSVRTVMVVIPAGVPDEGEPAACSCCQTRSLAGQAGDLCARCDHPGLSHVTYNGEWTTRASSPDDPATLF